MIPLVWEPSKYFSRDDFGYVKLRPRGCKLDVLTPEDSVVCFMIRLSCPSLFTNVIYRSKAINFFAANYPDVAL